MGADGFEQQKPLTLIHTRWRQGAAGSNNHEDDKGRSGGRFLRLQYVFNGELAPLETGENTGVQNNAHGEISHYSVSFVNDGFSRRKSFATSL